MAPRISKSNGQSAPRRVRAGAQGLTSREIEILGWVARGMSAWKIGEVLNISKATVDDHAHRAVRKIGASNRTHAVAIAVRDGIVTI
jgi:LuxR family quorum sensing-dependent transcriptional regulator